MSTDTLDTFAEVDSTFAESLSGGAAVATLDLRAKSDEAKPSESKELPGGTHCTECEDSADWNGLSWCPLCGYHPALKRCVEIEREQVVETGPENLWEAIPSWAWILAGGVVAVIGASFLVRLQLAGDARLLAGWSFTQIALAEFATLVVHVLALIHASTVSDRYSPFDLFMKPLALWKPTFAQLPNAAWRVWVFAWSQTAMICAFAVIGGVNYNALFDDWGVEKRPKPNLVKAIAEQAGKNGGDPGTLEDSLNEAGAGAEAGGGGGSGDDADKKPDEEEAVPEAEAELPKAECLIFGYRQSQPAQPAEAQHQLQGDTENAESADQLDAQEISTGVEEEAEITSLLLATMVNNRLRYVGMISASSVPDETLDELRTRLPKLTQSKSFVACRLPAVWVRPLLMCEVEYKEWGYAHQMKKPKFVRMLEDIKRP